MSSVYTATVCPQCGFVAQLTTQLRTGRDSLICFRCGYESTGPNVPGAEPRTLLGHGVYWTECSNGEVVMGSFSSRPPQEAIDQLLQDSSATGQNIIVLTVVEKDGQVKYLRGSENLLRRLALLPGDRE